MIDLAAAAAKSSSAWDQPGTLGFIVVFGMGLILFFVFRSLAKHLRKLNEAARLEALQAESAQPGPTAAESADGPGDFVRSEHERRQSGQNALDLDL